MKKLLVLMVGLCLIAGTAAAREAVKRDLDMIEDSQGLTDDITPGLFGVAQFGTTWIGWVPPHGPNYGSPGVWDFDDGGTWTCPPEDGTQEYIKNGAYAQGWTSEEIFDQKGLYWHAEDYTDGTLACSAGPISGTYSAWCGLLESNLTLDQCFKAGTGYGHNWNQWLCKTVDLGANPHLKYKYINNTESGYDYGYVFIDSTSQKVCGGDVQNLGIDTLRCYDGIHGITAEDIDLGALSADTLVCDVDYANDYGNANAMICFVVYSDGGADDEDGYNPTCDGAMSVDDIIIDTATGPDTTDFETGDLDGWTPCPGWSSGDFGAIRSRSSILNLDVCGYSNCDMAGCVLTMYDPGVGGQHGVGGHYAGPMEKRVWSPKMDMSPYNDRGYVIGFDRYVHLPLENWCFYVYYARFVQHPDCQAGHWSTPVSDDYVYYAPTPVCNYREWGFSAYVPTDADSVQIGLSAFNGCLVWAVPCTNGNQTPIADNVVMGIWDLSAPQANIRPVDNYTDAFPEADTLVVPAEPGNCHANAAGNTALIDCANNKSQTGDFLRLADSLVISLDAPDVYAELCFRIRPGPCTNTGDAWWGRMGLTPTACEVTPTTACVRMDTAFGHGNGDTSSIFEKQLNFPGNWASMIHELDGRYVGEGEEIFPDSLFTPGTQIYYYIRTGYLPVPAPGYAYLPTTVDEGDITTWYEVEVLPNRCVPDNCLLYVDYYNRGGAEDIIGAALTALGRTYDKFDLRGESSHQANGVGNRLLGAGRYRLNHSEPPQKNNGGEIGPLNDHLTQYTVMLINSGHFDAGPVYSDGGTDTPDDPSNDIGFLDAWLNEGRYKGLWLNGDNVATDFATATTGPKPTFLSSTLNVGLVASSYRDHIGHPVGEYATCRALKTKHGLTAADNYWDTWDAIFLTGSACPPRYDYDVLDYGSGTGLNGYALQWDRTDLTYPPGGLAASIYNIFPAGNAPFDSVRTLVDGFTLHSLRDGGNWVSSDTTMHACGATPGLDYYVSIALWLRDVLGGDGVVAPATGFMYDRLTMLQYCPPSGSDTVVGVGGTGRTYANALFQNYPNPFRSSSGTTIHYSVAKAGAVEVRIFDVAGRLVNTIADRAKPGSNFVIWDGKAKDGRSVASGVYFYQIKTDGFSDQRKMILVN
jgi:hypothetical protein